MMYFIVAHAGFGSIGRLRVRCSARRPKEGELLMVSSHEEARRLAKRLMGQMTKARSLQLSGDISRSFCHQVSVWLIDALWFATLCRRQRALGYTALCFADGPRGVACGNRRLRFHVRWRGRTLTLSSGVSSG